MKIIVAGCNGNIGSYLCDKLNLSHSIFGLGTKKNSKLKKYFPVDLSKNDSSFKKTVKLLPNCDVLIFLVGLAHKKGNGKDINEFKKINKNTLVNLISELKENNKLPLKIIYGSTVSVYGEKIDQEIYFEDSIKLPYSSYGITKLAAEEYLFKHFSSQSWILRFSPVYFENFMLNINRRSKVKSIYFKVGDGETKLSLCNLENIFVVIEGIINDKIPQGVFNVSDKKYYSYNDILSNLGARFIVRIPRFIVSIFYVIGKISGSIFLKENSIKLISDNIFSSEKIKKYIDLPYVLNFSNDN